MGNPFGWLSILLKIIELDLVILKKLITHCKNNDRNAFKKLYDQNKRYWFTICLRYMACRILAHDMLQNRLFKIFKNINQFDPSRGSFSQKKQSKTFVNYYDSNVGISYKF